MRLEVCIDANDVERLAEFWQIALGYQRGSGEGQPYLNLVPPDEQGPIVFLQRVPESKVVKNRVHLDLYVDEPEKLVQRLLEIGATVLNEAREGEFRWWVMADPEGNEFCVLREKQ